MTKILCAPDGRVYVATDRNEVIVGRGNEWRAIRANLDDEQFFERIASYRLRSGPGVLWSIGNEHLLRFDGKKWKEIVCPDNE